MEQYEKLGQTIKFFRQLKSMSQDTLAVGICTSSYLSRIENGLVEAEKVIYEMLFERLHLNLETYLEEGNKLDRWLESIYNRLLSNEEISEEDINQLKYQYLKREYPSLQIKVDLVYARYLLSEDKNEEASYILQPMEKLLKPGMTREWQMFVAIITFLNLSLQNFDTILNREFQTNSEYYFSTTTSFEKANYLYHLAFACHRAYEFASAKKYIENAKQTFKNNYKPLFQVKLFSMNGVICNALGQTKRAIEEYYAAIEWLHHVPSISTNQQWASIYNNLAFAYETQRNYFLALKYYEESLNYLDSLHTKINYLRVLYFAGEINKLSEIIEQLNKDIFDKNSHHYFQWILITELIHFENYTNENLFNVEKSIFKHFIDNNHLELILTYGPKVAVIMENTKQYKRASELYRLLFETSKTINARMSGGQLS